MASAPVFRFELVGKIISCMRQGRILLDKPFQTMISSLGDPE
jgi:hypothetical protein